MSWLGYTYSVVLLAWPSEFAWASVHVVADSPVAVCLGHQCISKDAVADSSVAVGLAHLPEPSAIPCGCGSCSRLDL